MRFIAPHPSSQDAPAIVAAYQAGATLKVVGRQFGISAVRVMQILQARGIPRRTPYRKGGVMLERDKRRNAQIIFSHRNGESTRSIAGRFKLSMKRTAKIIRVYGTAPE